MISRKTHNGTAFDIALPVTGTPGVECRRGTGTTQNAHQIILTFPAAVTISGITVNSVDGLATGSFSVSSNVVTVALSAVRDVQRLTFTLLNVSDGAAAGDLSLGVDFLVGDTTGDRSVNAGDTIQTRNRSGQAIDGTNFRSDVNLDGFLNAGDSIIVRARSGNTISALEAEIATEALR
jgi:hypothetical protein